jgi:hypothetical protein
MGNLSVLVLGVYPLKYIDVPVSFFEEIVAEIPGSFVSDPAPFLVPCTDGAMFVFNVVIDLTIRGASCEISAGNLQYKPELLALWEQAVKPMDLEAAKCRFFSRPAADKRD